MGLAGQPDACSPLIGRLVVLRPFETGFRYFALPTGVRLALDESGNPDLRLTKVASGSERPVGLLEVSLRPVFDLEAALLLARKERVDADVLPIPIIGGFGRLRIVGDTRGAEVLGPPERVPRGNQGTWRIAREIEPDTTALLAAGLLAGTLGIQGVLEMEFDAVATRVEARVTLDPRRTHEALWTVAGPTGAVERAVLLQTLRASSAGFGINVMSSSDSPGTTNVLDQAMLAEAIVDRIRVRFGQPGAATSIPILASFTLTAKGSEQPGTLIWNLAEPVLTRCGWTASINAVEEAQRFGSSLAETVRELTTPSLDVGQRRVHIRGWLGDPLSGIAQAGVTVRVPPMMPNRPQGINKTFAFAAGVLDETMLIRLSPGEELKYEIKGFAFVSSPPFPPVRIDADPRWIQSRFALLGREDVGARFVDVALTSSLAHQSQVLATLSGHVGTQEIKVKATVPEPPRSLALAIHPKAMDLRLDVIATQRGGAATTAINGIPASGSMLIDLTTFAEFGSHKVIARLEQTNTSRLFDVETESESGERASLIVSQIPVEWAYHADNIFRSGYRFRSREQGQGQGQGEWSEWQSRRYDEEIVMPIDSSQQGPGSTSGSSHRTPFSKSIEGLFVSVSASPSEPFRYVPGAPTIKRDATDRCSFFATDLGSDRGMVQFETRWESSDEQQAKVLSAIASIVESRLTPIATQALRVSLESAMPIECSMAILVPSPEGGREVFQGPVQTTPPFNGLVRVMGMKDDVAVIKRALEGTKGLAFIRYRARFSGIPTVSARLFGRVDSSLREGDRSQAVDSDIKAGRLTLKTETMPGAQPQMVEEAKRRVTFAAEFVNWSTGTIDLTESIVSDSLVIERWSDLGAPGKGDGSPPAWAKKVVAVDVLDAAVESKSSVAKPNLMKLEIDGSGLDVSSELEVKGTIEYLSSQRVIARVPFAIVPDARVVTVTLPVGAQLPGDVMKLKWTERRPSGSVSVKQREVDPVDRLVL